MKPKLIVFDMDDVLWDLNGKAAKIAKIKLSQLTTFSFLESKNLTDEEKNRLLEIYTGTKAYKDIVFHSRMINLINHIYKNHKECRVLISSNCGSEQIRDLKRKALRGSGLLIPEEDIHLHVIDIETGSCRKNLPENMFIFVDDSPHNIALAKAKHKVMPAKYWNDVLVNGCLNGEYVYRPRRCDHLCRKIMEYIRNDVTADLIVAHSRNNVIGNKDGIPWRIKGEQAQFKELTTGNAVIMGRKTYEDIGRPLPGRLTIVVSNTKTYDMDEGDTIVKTARSLKEAIGMVPRDREAYIGGGASLYEEAIRSGIIRRMYITEIDMDVPVDDTTVFFPTFDRDEFYITAQARSNPMFTRMIWQKK